METKVNLVLMALLGGAWATLTLAEPAAALDPRDPGTEALVALEDAFAAHPDDPALVGELAARYLDLGQAERAIDAVRVAEQSVRRDPRVLRELARAYERAGRLEDAHATVLLAHALCARALGAEGAAGNTPVPAHGCSPRTLVALQLHERALIVMRRWGIADPARDPRVDDAYRVASRAARVLSARR